MSDENWARRWKQERLERERAERLLKVKSEALFETEQTLRLALWASNEVFWSYDTSQATLSIKRNDHLQQMTETLNARAELLALIHPEDRENVQRKYATKLIMNQA